MPTTNITTEFVGRRGHLFWLSLKTSILTLLTLGFYRFWAKTRIRRFYWSAVRPGGHPLEYVGEPVEKLLGFLIAVVILAFYVGVINLLLMFASFSLFQQNTFAYVISFVGVLPILFYARYRARRYILARTRWRGMRFGLTKGAWGYAWRAMLHWLLTIATLGIMYPRQAFYLEKYLTDHTTYGSAQLHQGGRWQMLYPYMWWVIIATALSGLTIWGVVSETLDAKDLWLLLILIPAALASFIRFKVQAFRLMANQKTAGGISLRSDPKTGKIIRYYLLGYTLIGVFFLAYFMALGFTVVFAFPDCMQDGQFSPATCSNAYDLPTWVMTAISVVIYFLTFILWSVLKHVLVTLPVFRHYAETLEINGAMNLRHVTQSTHDEFTEAEGFSDALDLGAAI